MSYTFFRDNPHFNQNLTFTVVSIVFLSLKCGPEKDRFCLGLVLAAKRAGVQIGFLQLQYKLAVSSWNSGLPCWLVLAASCPRSTARLPSILHCFWVSVCASDIFPASLATHDSREDSDPSKFISLGVNKRFTRPTQYRCLLQLKFWWKWGLSREKMYNSTNRWRICTKFGISI